MQVAIKYTKGDGTITVESTYHLKRATIPAQGFAEDQEIPGRIG